MQKSAWLSPTSTDVIMNIPEYNKKLGEVINDLKGDYNAKIMLGIGIEAIRMIKTRVIETGINAEGAKFKGYSTKPMLVGCKPLPKDKCAMIFGSKQKRKELEWRTVNGHRLAILPGGYKQWRQIYGVQTDHVDFSVTNNMWNDINIISKQGDHQNGVAIIGAKQEIEKKKLAGNTKRRGDILDLNAKEIEDLKLTYNVGVLQIFRNNGL